MLNKTVPMPILKSEPLLWHQNVRGMRFTLLHVICLSGAMCGWLHIAVEKSSASSLKWECRACRLSTELCWRLTSAAVGNFSPTTSGFLSTGGFRFAGNLATEDRNWILSALHHESACFVLQHSRTHNLQIAPHRLNSYDTAVRMFSYQDRLFSPLFASVEKKYNSLLKKQKLSWYQVLSKLSSIFNFQNFSYHSHS